MIASFSENSSIHNYFCRVDVCDACLALSYFISTPSRPLPLLCETERKRLEQLEPAADFLTTSASRRPAPPTPVLSARTLFLSRFQVTASAVEAAATAAATAAPPCCSLAATAAAAASSSFSSYSTSATQVRNIPFPCQAMNGSIMPRTCTVWTVTVRVASLRSVPKWVSQQKRCRSSGVKLVANAISEKHGRRRMYNM